MILANFPCQLNQVAVKTAWSIPEPGSIIPFRTQKAAPVSHNRHSLGARGNRSCSPTPFTHSGSIQDKVLSIHCYKFNRKPFFSTTVFQNSSTAGRMYTLLNPSGEKLFCFKNDKTATPGTIQSKRVGYYRQMPSDLPVQLKQGLLEHLGFHLFKLDEQRRIIKCEYQF